MKNYIGRVIILVHDYNEAFTFYESNFGFKTIFDVTTEGKRYLHIGAEPTDSCGIWLLKAEGTEQTEKVGNQTSGQPTLVIYTTSLENLYQRLKENGVTIKLKPVTTTQYKFLHCLDLYGNEIVIVELGK